MTYQNGKSSLKRNRSKDQLSTKAVDGRSLSTVAALLSTKSGNTSINQSTEIREAKIEAIKSLFELTRETAPRKIEHSSYSRQNSRLYL